MPLYQVRAKDEAGESLSRVFSAATERAAVEQARLAGLFTLRVERMRARTEPTLLSRAALAAAPVKPADQALFFRHLAPLVKVGMGTPYALGRMARRLPDPRLRALAAELARETEAGASLSQSLAARGGFFPAWVAGTLAAAESGGKADELLPAIRDELELEEGFHRRFAIPIAYLRASVALGVLVPTLPFLITLGFRGWTALAAIVCGFALLLVYGAMYAKRYRATSPAGAAAADGAVLMVPGLGGMRRDLAVLRFVRVLRSMDAAGLPIGGAWAAAALAAGHRRLRAAFARGERALLDGAGLAKALEATGLFARATLDAAAAAETGGTTPAFLEWLEGDAAREADRASDRGRKAMWGLLLAAAGLVIVVCAVIAMASLMGNMFKATFDLIEEV